jgi:uncharacterized protein YceK
MKTTLAILLTLLLSGCGSIEPVQGPVNPFGSYQVDLWKLEF